MAFLEILVTVFIILVALLLWKLYKQQKPTEEVSDTSTKLFLDRLEKIEKTIEKKAESDDKRQDTLKKCIEENIATFTRTIHGTKRRGKVGEVILKEMLAESIKSNLIQTNLQTDDGVVEFAWDLKNGKFLPIDSKLPELDSLYGQFEKSEDVGEQTKLKKEITKIIEKRKNEAKKYLNNQNTIDKCIIAIPDAIADMIPDINKDSIKTGVFVTGYTKVFLFACVLGEHYVRSLESGDIGLYRQTIGALKNIFQDIEKKTNTINKGIKQVDNANSDIKTEVGKSMNKIGQLGIEKKQLEQK